MDERHIPDPKIRPEWKKSKPRGEKGLVREFVLKRLQEGRLTDAQIAEECAILYDGSTSVKSVQWYKCHFNKEKLLEKTGKKRSKRKYLTEFTYEVIFKLADPPDNVEVLTAKTLVSFAQKIVKTYAKFLPKSVEEIVYDVRTAKYYLEQTGKFEVIDQNNYANPFIVKQFDSEGNEISSEEFDPYSSEDFDDSQEDV